jgi:hypothetical protein
LTVITREDAGEIAAGWARRESLERGYECTPSVAEFDLGFVVWTVRPRTVLPVPGDSPRTVIDRDTGLLSLWPSIPPDAVAEAYREHRPDLVAQRRTLDPEVELRRNARRRPSPATAAHITVDGRLFIGRGAKGDQRIEHHPLVTAFLGSVPRGRLVRGADRHAELIALSDLLHEADRARAGAGGPPVTLDDMRAWLRTASFTSFFIRESGDPLAGTPSRPCETCTAALVDFALLPWSELGHVTDWRSTAEQIPQPGRFPDEVAAVLAGGGWMPLHEESRAALADLAVNDAVQVAGQTRRHEPFPAVRTLLADFPTVSVLRRGTGVRRLIRPFTIEPMVAAHSADVLGEFAEVVGAAVFPIGVEARGDTWLVADERGRVFALDQGGEWFLGETVDEALIGLLTGDGPAERITDDGTW